MEYIIVTSRVEGLPGEVKKYLSQGWQLFGYPFRTGNQIAVGGDPCWPRSRDWNSEIAQALIRIELNDKQVTP